jgi:hypothetical protein
VSLSGIMRRLRKQHRTPIVLLSRVRSQNKHGGKQIIADYIRGLTRICVGAGFPRPDVNGNDDGGG